jgi:hypothetical protein
LADNLFALATNSVPEDDAAFLGSPSVIGSDVAAEANLGRISGGVPGPFGRRRS